MGVYEGGTTRCEECGAETADNLDKDVNAQTCTPCLILAYGRDDDAGDQALEELHDRAANGDRAAAAAVLNDSDLDDPNWTYETGKF
jgi:hypothetical protein